MSENTTKRNAIESRPKETLAQKQTSTQAKHGMHSVDKASKTAAESETILQRGWRALLNVPKL